MEEFKLEIEARAALQAVLADVNSPLLLAALERWRAPRPVGAFAVGKGTVYGDDAVFVAWDSADPVTSRWPYLARMVRLDGRWVVTSVLAQCTACFGSGFVEPESSPCPSCLARGWGLLGSEDYNLPTDDIESVSASGPQVTTAGENQRRRVAAARG